MSSQYRHKYRKIKQKLIVGGCWQVIDLAYFTNNIVTKKQKDGEMRGK
jgi:hypothetical protein